MRLVRVTSVEIVEWSTLALASGVEVETGKVVQFAFPKGRAAAVRAAIRDGATPTVEVDDLAILFEEDGPAVEGRFDGTHS